MVTVDWAPYLLNTWSVVGPLAVVLGTDHGDVHLVVLQLKIDASIVFNFSNFQFLNKNDNNFKLLLHKDQPIRLIALF